MVPATSRPGVIGSEVGITSASTPNRMWSSTGLNEVAATFTSTSPAPGTGRSTSSWRRTSVVPNSWYRIAFTAFS